MQRAPRPAGGAGRVGAGASSTGGAGAVPGEAGDPGFSLVELLVASAMLVVVLLLFGAGMIQMFRSVGRTEAQTATQAQLHVAFSRLDRAVRYASSIADPGDRPAADGYWYVELLTDTTCSQLRVGVAANSQLQLRTWPVAATPTADWVTLATGVSPLGHSPAASSSSAGGSATSPGGSARPAPFSLINADSAGPSHQQLAVDLTASAGGTRDYLARDLRISFTALNTSVDTAPPDECTRRRPAS